MLTKQYFKDCGAAAAQGIFAIIFVLWFVQLLIFSAFSFNYLIISLFLLLVRAQSERDLTEDEPPSKKSKTVLFGSSNNNNGHCFWVMIFVTLDVEIVCILMYVIDIRLDLWEIENFGLKFYCVVLCRNSVLNKLQFVLIWFFAPENTKSWRF
jgi:hypothetical protein